jgi:starch synthase
MHYGTLPVARLVGGLADSVTDAGDATVPCPAATGFCFAEESALGLLAGLDRARVQFAHPDTWHRMQRTAMARDFSWETAARRYLELYEDLVHGFDVADPSHERRIA